MLNQTFPVIYQNQRFLVDPVLLSNASKKFCDLLNSNQDKIQNPCLRINSDLFTSRIISNFLQICQNQTTDTQNSELKEICLLARMFQAEEIFNTAFNFIKNEIDSDFYISQDQLNEIDNSQNLIIETEALAMQNTYFDLSDFEFDDSYEQAQENDKAATNLTKAKKPSVCYQIKVENPLMKCHRFYLLKDDKVIYMAKQRYDEIYIGKENSCHLKKDKHLNDAKIQRDFRGYNIISVPDQEFKVKYLKIGEKFLIKTTFDHKLGKQIWVPKQDDFQKMLKGEYNHAAMKSRKNLVMQNERKHPTFIFRKMKRNVYEAECSQEADPIVTFALAISQIIGPIAF